MLIFRAVGIAIVWLLLPSQQSSSPAEYCAVQDHEQAAHRRAAGCDWHSSERWYYHKQRHNHGRHSGGGHQAIELHNNHLHDHWFQRRNQHREPAARRQPHQQQRSKLPLR